MKCILCERLHFTLPPQGHDEYIKNSSQSESPRVLETIHSTFTLAYLDTRRVSFAHGGLCTENEMDLITNSSIYKCVGTERL